MEFAKKASDELHAAFQAREFENEGMARVCARRAAGWAIKDYLQRKHVPIPTPNAFSLLKDESIRYFLPAEAVPIIEHLTLRVGQDFNLPAEVDLLQETRHLLALFDIPFTEEG
jgi:hypothetical protein